MRQEILPFILGKHGRTIVSQGHLSTFIIVQDQFTVYIRLRLNERKDKQTLGINWILGMNDNFSKLDILVFTSAYK